MKTVYLLESISHPGKRYVGITTGVGFLDLLKVSRVYYSMEV